MSTTDLAVANTILEQLGGQRFIAMTGAKNLVGDEKGLQFRLPRAAKGITNIKIVLDDSDTYTVSFYKCKKWDVALLSEQTMVDNSSLRAVFTAATGLYTSL